MACLVNCVKSNSVEHPITLDDTAHRLEDTACQSLDVSCTISPFWQSIQYDPIHHAAAPAQCPRVAQE